MPLIASISGIRGVFGDGLNPAALVRYVSAYGAWSRRRAQAFGKKPLVVVGRDARVTGDLCARIVTATLQSTGCDVVDAGLATTPTVQLGVLKHRGIGGIMISASHNPAQWNALKLFNQKGEYLTAEEGGEVLALSEAGVDYTVAYDEIGGVGTEDLLEYHIRQILYLDYIDPDRIADQGFVVVVDAVNSVGGIAVPALLKALGVADKDILCMNCEPTGRFAHDPEPLPENLTGIMEKVASAGADLGIVVDPDADRLALVEDGGGFFGEELTQVLAADFLFRFNPGPFVTNLSSSRAIDDVAARYGQPVYRAAVGEINVVQKMHEVGAVLGGEGNGGVILPDLHYGRDALVGIALTLQYLAERNLALSQVKAEMPQYAIVKHKVPLGTIDADALLEHMARRYQHERLSTVDGVKIDFEEGWIHLRKSNTEPIIRIYAEGTSKASAQELAERFTEELLAVDRVA